MSFDVNAIDSTRVYRAASARPAAAAGADAFSGAVDTVRGDVADTIPASPPAELRAEMLVAQRAFDELHARGRELHFDMSDGRVRIEMRDLDGNVLKQIPVTQALEIASGRIPE